MKEKIIQQLTEIEQVYNMKVLLAVESGSRSWGFHSHNSDYDIRFIYAPSPECYLSITKGRDVIERDDGFLDFVGWDLRKTLQLFRKSNCALMEYLSGPDIYVEHGELASRLRSLAKDHYSPKPLSYHYLHMAKGNYQGQLRDREMVSRKKYLYVLRALLNIQWMNEKSTMPPMDFMETVSAVNLSEEERSAIIELITEKKSGRELGMGKRDKRLDILIAKMLDNSEQICKDADVMSVPTAFLDEIFRDTLSDVWGGVA